MASSRPAPPRPRAWSAASPVAPRWPRREGSPPPAPPPRRTARRGARPCRRCSGPSRGAPPRRRPWRGPGRRTSDPPRRRARRSPAAGRPRGAGSRRAGPARGSPGGLHGLDASASGPSRRGGPTLPHPAHRGRSCGRPRRPRDGQQVVLEEAACRQAVASPPGPRRTGPGRRDPDPVSKSVERTTGTPRSAAAAAISASATGPPTRAGLITRTSAAPAARSPCTADAEEAASSAARGIATSRRSAAAPARSSAGSGCSTYSISKRAIAARRSSAVGRSHAPLTSTRRRMSGPTACRIARTRATRSSVSRSAPAFSLSVVKPASMACRAASAPARGARCRSCR